MAITLASTSSSGTQSSWPSSFADISSDGRYIVFMSESSGPLVSNDSNAYIDIFLKDIHTGTTTRISTSSTGAESNGDSFYPSISDDGRYVVFNSNASNLVSGDTNNQPDVFLKDTQTGTLTRLSISSSGTQGDADSFAPVITGNGKYIVFTSAATTLVAGDSNQVRDVFLYNRETGSLSLISQANGKLGNDQSSADSARDTVSSVSLACSSDGRYIVFSSAANNLVTGDTNGVNDIFLKDTTTGEVTRISVSEGGNQGNGHSYAASITSDGRYVAFYSHASNLVPGDGNGVADVFLYDRLAATTSDPDDVTLRLISKTSSTEGNGDSVDPAVTSGGRYVVFSSSATNLVTGDSNGTYDIFLKDVKTGSLTRLSVSSSGADGNGESYTPIITPSGSYVVFYSTASNLVSSDNNTVADVFVAALSLTSDTDGANVITLTGTNKNDKSLNGTAAAELIMGLAGNDTLSGAAGDDTLIGGTGKDKLTGGTGADTFVFDNYSTSGASTADTVVDFNLSEKDKFAFDKTVFSKLGGGIDSKNVLIAAKVKAATTADQYLILDTSGGKLYYDADGSGKAYSAVLIAGINKAGLSGIDYTSFTVYEG